MRRTDQERFWMKVDRRGPDDCWPWLAYIDRDGYGRFTPTERDRRVPVGAHRLAYEWEVSAIAPGVQLDHQCHNRDTKCRGGVRCPHRRCVNPRHLTPATARENTIRGRTPARALAARTHCSQGHAFSGANLAIRKDGSRKCRACHRRYARRSRQRA